MHLFVVRHGIAQDRSTAAEPARALTVRGRRRTQMAAQGLKALGAAPGVIATSPLTRAEETARILAEVLCPGAEPEVLECLGPGGDASQVMTWLHDRDEDAVMLVGHMPDVAELMSLLLCGQDGMDVTFKKAAVCCLTVDPVAGAGGARLEWLLQPGQLRALATP